MNGRWKLAGHGRPLPAAFVEPLHGLRGLEIGGPSAVFGTDGKCPVYPRLQSCDGVQWKASTAWHDLSEAEPYAPEGRPTGTLHVADGGLLDDLSAGSFDVVFSSHVIEHFANPLRALARWRRVLVDEGWLLLVAPHKAGTFDHRRSVTSLGHLIEDRELGTDEDDLTHLDETLRLHDRSRDSDASGREDWAAARHNNLNTRLLHHHVFDGELMLRTLDAADVQIEQVEVRHPHDIFVLGRFVRSGQRPDNSSVLALNAAWRYHSPFPLDRADAAPGFN